MLCYEARAILLHLASPLCVCSGGKARGAAGPSVCVRPGAEARVCFVLGLSLLGGRMTLLRVQVARDSGVVVVVVVVVW
jgi:hypothetical protein